MGMLDRFKINKAIDVLLSSPDTADPVDVGPLCQLLRDPDLTINVFPASEQPRIRTMLCTSLRGVISQQLLRRADGKGRLAALEILTGSAAVASIIREGKTGQLAGVIERGAFMDMQSIENTLRNMLEAKLITGDEAYHKAVNKSNFEQFRTQEPVV